jgi:hypothetical protein
LKKNYKLKNTSYNVQNYKQKNTEKFLQMLHGVQGGQFFQKAPPWPPEAKKKGGNT